MEQKKKYHILEELAAFVVGTEEPVILAWIACSLECLTSLGQNSVTKLKEDKRQYPRSTT